MWISKLAFVLFAGIVAAHPVRPPCASTSQGRFEGFVSVPGVEAFLGIPYAQPPVETLRFKPPKPLAPTTLSSARPRLATSFSDTCMQVHYTSPLGAENLKETTPQGEDCLTVNIWRPAGTHESSHLPVLIWLFGGAFSEGGSSVAIYNPENIVQNNPEVVIVTLNYRLGIFGFPMSPVEHGNLGLLDQRLAMEWVRDNIAAFGGDSSKMVLWGQSAASVAISAYSFTYKDDPIVRGFILESGVASGIGDADSGLWDLAASNVGCADEDREKELECMRNLPAQTLSMGVSNMTVNSIGTSNGGSPFVDNITVFPVEGYAAMLENGDFAQLPTLMGSNNAEGEGVVNFSPKCGLNDTLAAAITTSRFTCPVSEYARHIRGHGSPVWRYRYMPNFPSLTRYPFFHAFHIAEVPMVMGTFSKLGIETQPQSVEVEASRYLQKVWVAFARDPAAGLETEMGWPLYNPTEPTLVELFANNSANAAFVDPAKYDIGCDNPPILSWEDYGASPLSC